MKRACLVLALASCASGPRPLPATLSATERLAATEEALLGAKASAAFELNSEGAHTAHLTGTLELTGSNGLQVVAEGRYDQEDVRVEFESLKGDVNRSVTRGPSVNAHHADTPPRLAEAVSVGLVRQGLLHNLSKLVADQPLSHAEGGVRDQLKVVDVQDGGADTVDGEGCHRVKFGLTVGGTAVGTSSLCVSDQTALPLARDSKFLLDRELVLREHFTWTLKK